MKRTLSVMVALVVAALTSQGQSRFWFSSTIDAPNNPVTIALNSQQGPVGAYVGSDYSVQCLWVFGTFTNQAEFDAAGPTVDAITTFFGTTGFPPDHGPADGAGWWDGPMIQVGPRQDWCTVQARVWYNGGIYSTYADALAAGKNTGLSSLARVNANAPPGPPDITRFPAFTVTTIPEPSAAALVGLGLAALIAFGCRRADLSHAG